MSLLLRKNIFSEPPMKRAVVLPDATFLLPSPYGIEKSQENLFLQGFYHPKCPTRQKDGRFTLFEMKFNPKKAAAKLPKAFMETYDVERTAVVPPPNWTEWLL